MKSRSPDYSNCFMCPRECGVNRYNTFGFCHEGVLPHLAWCGLHNGEEPVISTGKGSGMFFFTGCSLGCKYCQNFQISKDALNFKNFLELTIDKAVELAWGLKEAGAGTLNLVTAEHHTPFVMDFLKTLKSQNYPLPIVYNTSGWVSISSLSVLLPYVDIWLWDLKTMSSDIAKMYCGSENYPTQESRSFSFLYTNLKEFNIIDKNKGVLIRHLVLPGCVNDSKKVIDEVVHNRDKCMFSLMSQFVNPSGDGGVSTLNKDEWNEVLEYLDASNFDNGFVQELSDKEEEWKCDFNNTVNPFKAGYATVLPRFLELKEGL